MLCFNEIDMGLPIEHRKEYRSVNITDYPFLSDLLQVAGKVKAVLLPVGTYVEAQDLVIIVDPT